MASPTPDVASQSSRPPRPALAPESGAPPEGRAAEARRQIRYELISGLSGVALAFVMWGHMFLVGSILTGQRGFNALAGGLEDYWIAQPTVVAITILFLVHGAMASRKIPGQIRDRRRMRRLNKELHASQGSLPGHVESSLWIWQVWTGMILLVTGSFHLVLVGVDVCTDLYGGDDRTGADQRASASAPRNCTERDEAGPQRVRFRDHRVDQV